MCNNETTQKYTVQHCTDKYTVKHCQRAHGDRYAVHTPIFWPKGICLEIIFRLVFIGVFVHQQCGPVGMHMLIVLLLASVLLGPIFLYILVLLVFTCERMCGCFRCRA